MATGMRAPYTLVTMGTYVQDGFSWLPHYAEREAAMRGDTSSTKPVGHVLAHTLVKFCPLRDMEGQMLLEMVGQALE